MSSHWSSIGLPVEGEEIFRQFANVGLSQGEQFDVGAGLYIRWRCGQGPEIWFQRIQNSIAMNPHFAGETTIPLTLTAAVKRPDESALDGGFQGSVEVPAGDDVVSIPLIFDTPNFLTQQSLHVPAPAVIQLTGFAHTLTLYPNENAFAATHGGTVHLSPFSFIPAGLAPDVSGGLPPAQASFGGVVEDCTMLINPMTQGKFWWARVHSIIGEIDVVADLEDVPRVLQKQDILWGSFYLSGLIKQSQLK